MQVIMLATVALAVGSLCTVAVPKLAGDLIDICIHYGQGTFDAKIANHKLNGTRLPCSRLPSLLTAAKHMTHPLCRHAVQDSDCAGSWWSGQWHSILVSWLPCPLNFETDKRQMLNVTT